MANCSELMLGKNTRSSIFDVGQHHAYIIIHRALNFPTLIFLLHSSPKLSINKSYKIFLHWNSLKYSSGNLPNRNKHKRKRENIYIGPDLRNCNNFPTAVTYCSILTWFWHFKSSSYTALTQKKLWRVITSICVTYILSFLIGYTSLNDLHAFDKLDFLMQAMDCFWKLK